MKIWPFNLLLLVFVYVTVISAQTREIRINLADPAGAAVTDASVKAAAGKAANKTCSKDENAFVCTIAESGGVVFQVLAKGFKPLRVEYAEKDVNCCEYVFVLQLETLQANVVAITRSWSVIENTPESVSVLDRPTGDRHSGRPDAR